MSDVAVFVNPAREIVATENSIINGVQSTYREAGFQTNLTLKSVIRGRAAYRTRHSCYDVTPGKFLILNQGQRYQLEMDPPMVTETLAIFFKPDLVAGVFGELAAGVEKLLECPRGHGVDPPEFVETFYPSQGSVPAILKRIHQARPRSPFGSRELLPGYLFDLLGELFSLHGRTRQVLKLGPGKKLVTGEETFRRVMHAKDWIDANFAHRIQVSEMARVACMSPFHFHRSFRQILAVSPARYLQQIRLQRSAEYLARDADSISEICALVGFESHASFSHLFQRHFGITPSAYRQQARRSPVRCKKSSNRQIVKSGSVYDRFQQRASEQYLRGGT